eukprot:GHRQ01034968.1.p2 GENE.GHRQ01034968.1~~GHRQ01034968.1.p2  ORF type:complete len:192 (+),score=16.82 GHRQ01034968.1:112-687(+)
MLCTNNTELQRCRSRAVPKLLRVGAPLCATVVHRGQVGAPELGVAAAVRVVAVTLQARRVALVACDVVPASQRQCSVRCISHAGFNLVNPYDTESTNPRACGPCHGEAPRLVTHRAAVYSALAVQGPQGLSMLLCLASPMLLHCVAARQTLAAAGLSCADRPSPQVQTKAAAAAAGQVCEPHHCRMQRSHL